MENKTLFIGATHGDEVIGVQILENISKQRKNFNWIIGNEKAYKIKKRFFQRDLNRCGKGDIKSTVYEEKRAAEIHAIAKQYQYTIDIHGTFQDTGTFLLITNPTKDNLRLASYFDIEKLIIWPSITNEMKYPLSEFFSTGIEIEVGRQTEEVNILALEKSINTYLDKIELYEQENDEIWQNRLTNKNIYEMYGNIPMQSGISKDNLREQTETTQNDETFTPIFVGTYKYENIMGYKIRSLRKSQIVDRFLT